MNINARADLQKVLDGRGGGLIIIVIGPKTDARSAPILFTSPWRQKTRESGLGVVEMHFKQYIHLN